MHGAESDKYSLFPPGGRHEEGSLIPNSAQVIPQFARCRDIVIRRGNRHLHHFSYLQVEPASESLLTTCDSMKINIYEALSSIILRATKEDKFDKWDSIITYITL